MARYSKVFLREVRFVFGGKTLSDIAEKRRYGIATKDELARWQRHLDALARRRERRGRKLRVFRERIGVTQSELSDILGVNRKTVYRLEKGLHTPREGTLVLLDNIGFCWKTNRWTLKRKEAVAATKTRLLTRSGHNNRGNASNENYVVYSLDGH